MTHRSNGNFVRNSVFKIKIIHWKLSFVNSKHNKIIFGKKFQYLCETEIQVFVSIF